jgi:tellurium resistance protein TerZ
MVNLSKGQKISLGKSGGGGLTQVKMGLGWDVKKIRKEVKSSGFFGFGAKTQIVEEEQSIDLDASCILFDEQKRLVDTVWFRQLKSKDGSIVHSGDNRTGAGDGDDESIMVDLTKLPERVHQLVFVINSFTGQNFNEIEGATARLVDTTSNKELARYTLTGGGSHTAQIMVRLFRGAGGWELQALGIPGSGRTFIDLVPLMGQYL